MKGNSIQLKNYCKGICKNYNVVNKKFQFSYYSHRIQQM